MIGIVLVLVFIIIAIVLYFVLKSPRSYTDNAYLYKSSQSKQPVFYHNNDCQTHENYVFGEGWYGDDEQDVSTLGGNDFDKSSNSFQV
jgi:hypothetical protein